MKYELIIILKSNLTQAEAEKKYSEFLKKEGFTVNNVLWWGKKTLAYEIKKQTEGSYIFFEISSNNNVNPNLISNKFKIDNEVLRSLVLKKEEKE